MASSSPSKSAPPHALQATGSNHTVDRFATPKDVLCVIDSLKKKVTADRLTYIKNKIEENKLMLSTFTQNTLNLSKNRASDRLDRTGTELNLLTRRQADALSALHGVDPCVDEKEGSGCQEDGSYALSALFMGGGGKNSIRTIKLPEVPKLPSYTSWIFLDRNQRMSEDQSVVGRRRIYYDQDCGEALICSDSEDEVAEDEEDKKEFRDVEDFIIRMTIQETGCSNTVLEELGRCFDRTADDIKARYETLSSKKDEDCVKTDFEADNKVEETFLHKDLDAALDSFDNLFCRRCLVFDCRLHGCSQDLVFPVSMFPSHWFLL